MADNESMIYRHTDTQTQTDIADRHSNTLQLSVVYGR